MPDATPQKCSLSPVNDKAVLLNCDGVETSSNAGLMLLATIEQRLGLSGSLASCLDDPRDPVKTGHLLKDIFKFRAMMVAAGYEDGNDAHELHHDPSFKLALERAPETGDALCSQPTISRMENMADTRSLVRMQHELIRVYCKSFKRAPATMVLDIDETFDEVHGGQQLSLFNGYYGGYGYQPILVFDEAGRLVSSVLRPVGRPSGKEAACHIRRLMRSIRRHWPKTRILLRADGHYSTPEVMDLCDTLGVDYVFGLPTNSRVRKLVKTRVADTEKRYEQHYAGTGKKLRQFDTCSYGAHSWGGERRVIVRIEVEPMEPDTRFIVTGLSGHRSKYLYEKIYCARGQAENYIKSWKRHLASDRTSCSKANANQMRLVIHHCAYWLMWTLRAACPKRSRWRRSQFDTLRLNLIRIAATVVEKKTRIIMSLPASCPQQSLIRLLFEGLAPPHSA